MQNIIQKHLLNFCEDSLRHPRIKGERIVLLFAFIFIFLPAKQTFALHGKIGSHDPSALVKDGAKYWEFTTGKGIYSAYSTDLINWSHGPRPVFPNGTWPSWIDTSVPGFKGEFWAPDCIFMNGKYYLYYSCSTFGSPRSAIGVVVNATLDPNSSIYQWTDLGLVVASSVKKDLNAIDPGIFKDANGKVYMTYGSFHGGIGVVEIDTVTGKQKADALITKIAGGKEADWEAPYLIKEGDYYYLFVNRGFCCRGASSTYNIVMGRSTIITGPYTDKKGIDLNEGGGTLALGSSGRYIGPGHFGLLRENGINFVSIHYYDGEAKGAPKLDILNMGFSDGWPYLTRDWITNGEYKITNKNSGLVWGLQDCKGGSKSIVQVAWSNHKCQKWNITSLGQGNYKITNVTDGRVANVTNCDAANGALLQLSDSVDNDCQKFKIEKAADGSNVLTSLTAVKIVETAKASTLEGAQISLWDYTGNICQKWAISPSRERRRKELKNDRIKE